MKVRIHSLFRYLLETTEANPELVVGLSLSDPPRLGEFLPDLDPNMPLDWNNVSFQGRPVLRDRVLDQAGLGESLRRDNVLITAGAAEANYLAIRQLLQPGDEIVLEQPGWPQAEVLAKAIGVTIRRVHRVEADGWALPLEALGAAMNDRTRLIFLTNPNNPTGRLLSAEALERIVSMADRVGAWLLVDEVYAGLEWNGARAPSVAGLYRRGITTGSVSKALGLQGLRTGWLICPDPELVKDAVILRENSSEIMNVLGEVIAEAALEPERYATALTQARRDGWANLERLDAIVAAEPDLSWQAPHAGLIGLARLPGGIDSEDFARRLLAPPYRTFLIPGAAYECPHHIRLGVGGGLRDDLDRGMARIGQLLAAW